MIVQINRHQSENNDKHNKRKLLFSVSLPTHINKVYLNAYLAKK